MPESPAPYRVLARKYRPQRFAALIGQDAMVQTLANAIRRDRLAHAFLLTGVRGVGKTSTARLIAKALNCIGADGQGGPTIDPCGACEFCVSIAEGRNLDVIEMDAASHTGVDDMRAVIDMTRNTGFGGRFQVFIIDEVHMLSKNAFNALLKTLEEPPPGVKFILATTEVSKVPVTVLSRCQRFDLRRIPADKLAAHFAEVAKAEGVAADGEALALIARAAEGSARDGLSILDQAIAHADAGADGVTAPQVREMLGLSDRGAVRSLLGLLLAGDAPAALAALAEQHALGVEPAALFRGLLEAVHGVTRRKAGGGDDPAQSAEERAALTDWAGSLSNAMLHRLWQLLLKGLDEVQSTAMPLEAAEMALLRIIHASELPDPGELARRLRDGAPIAPPAAPAPASVLPGPVREEAPPPPPGAPADMQALVDLLETRGAHQLAAQLFNNARIVRFAPPELSLRSKQPLPADLGRLLKERTGQPWSVRFDEEGDAEPSLAERKLAGEQADRDAILASPIVAAALASFPDAVLL